jgi:hypothetical protein
VIRPLLVLLLLALAAPGSAWAQAEEPVRGLVESGRADVPVERLYGRRVALIVGIDDYEEPALRLRSARHGAQAVSDALVQDYAFDEVITLMDGEASRDAVLAALADLRRLKAEDALLIFWAGHGGAVHDSNDEEVGYLVPWDGSLGGDRALADNISMEEVRSLVGLAIPARHKLLVVDACYGGLLTLRGSGPLLPHDQAWLQEVVQRPVFQVITAGEVGQSVLDNGPGGHSVFTGRFLEALDETDDYITASELAATLQRRVRADAFARGGHEQTPAFGRLSGTGDFVLLRADAAASLVSRGAWAPAPRTPPASRTLAATAVAALLVGAAGLVTAGVSREEYVSSPLADGDQPELVALNRAAGVTGLAAIGAGAFTLGAAFVVAEW